MHQTVIPSKCNNVLEFCSRKLEIFFAIEFVIQIELFAIFEWKLVLQHFSIEETPWQRKVNCSTNTYWLSSLR